MWREAADAGLQAMGCFPELAYVGWDLAMTPDGPLLVEINPGLPNPNIARLVAPILNRPEVRRFFHEVGVLLPRRMRAIEAALACRPDLAGPP